MSDIDDFMKSAAEKISNDLQKAMNEVFISKKHSVDFIPSIDFIPITITIDGVKTTDCQHIWLQYVGLKECFFYCKKCDQKQ